MNVWTLCYKWCSNSSVALPVIRRNTDASVLTDKGDWTKAKIIVAGSHDKRSLPNLSKESGIVVAGTGKVSTAITLS